MNKTIKLSLATALLAGLVSNANASTKLEEALKDVKIKGYVSYTMEKYLNKDSKDDEAQHDIDVRVQIDVPVNDNYSLTVRVDEVNDDDTDKNPNDADSSDKDSSALQPEIDQVYVTYKDAGLKIKTGMQKLIAPRLHDSINGDGMIVSYKVSNMATISGAYFYTSEKTNTDEVAALALSGKDDAFNYGLTYASIIDSKDTNNDGSVGDNGAKIIDLTAGMKVTGVKVALAHTTRSDDAVGSKDQKLTKLSLSGKTANIKFAAAYAMVGKNGANVAIDGDADASVNLVLDAVSTDALQDANAVYLMLGTNLSKTISASAEYVTASADAGTIRDAKEIMLKVSNKVTKKLKLFANYNIWETKDVNGLSDEDRTKVTLGAKYSF